jgi:hypothetical protein
MFEIISSLRPYFYSLREIEGHISLDIKIPSTWSYLEIIETYLNEIKYKVQDKNTSNYLISIISTANEYGYEIVVRCVHNIIKYNKEQEEKKRLFDLKLAELKKIFEEESLEKLKSINFINSDGGEQENTASFGMVGEGNEEG